MNEQNQSILSPEPRFGPKLATALAKAHENIGAAVKGAANPFFKSKYATLGDVLAVCKEPLSSNGLSILQLVGADTNGAYLETILLHSSGEYIASTMAVTPTKANDLQALGSAITYCRRYALQSMMCIPSVDDDAEWTERAMKNRPEAPQSHDLEAMQLILKQHEENAMAATTESERKRYQGLAADMRIVIQEAWDKQKPVDLKKINKEIADAAIAQGTPKENIRPIVKFEPPDEVPMTHATDPVKTVEAKVDQVEPPKKETRRVPEKPDAPEPTEKKPASGSNDPLVTELSKWADYRVHLTTSTAFHKTLKEFSQPEIAILYKKRSLPFLSSDDSALKLEAEMIRQAHDSK